jgi:hypothetical protein
LYQIENNDKNEISVNNNNNNDNSSNNSFNQSETNSITISVTSYSTTSSCEDDENDGGGGGVDDTQEDENEEFQAIYKRITTSTNKNIEANLNNLATSDINALRNLFKLLKLYKLEHYMNDLVDQDYSSTFSLHKLKQNDLDKLNVSPYDKKKFFKLQLFIKQFMNTISLSSHNNNNNNKQVMTTNQQRRSSSCAASVTTSTEANNLIDDKVKKMITIKKQAQKPITVKTAAAAAANQDQKNETARSSSNQNLNQRHISRNYSGSNLNEPNWSNNKPPPPPSKPHFIKNSNLSNNKRIVAKTANKNRFSLVQRAKSSEPVKKVTTSLTSKSSTLIQDNNIIIPQVNHPNNPNSSSRVKCDYIENVQLIKTNTYNYGVPQMQKVSIKKSKSNHNLPIETTNSSTLTTNEIYVYARKRPKLACESKFSDVIQIQLSSSKSASIFVNESKQAVDGSPILRKNEFHFDKLFDETKTNEDIFKSSIQSYIDDNNSGNRNDFACICFGQTGSGKTHTLFGNKQQDGLCVLTADTLFKYNERILCGFYEIYNGQLYDLLNQKNRLVLREDSNGQVNVVGLVEIEVKSLAQLKKTIEQAQLNRHIGCTSFNKASSRSHAVIQFKVPNVSSSNSGQVIMTKQFTNSSSSKTRQTKTAPNKPFRVLFIDLAGSERGIDAQTNQNDNRKEGAEINQSLLALKECIRCIDQSCSHAPFRQSKLTRVLRDCFIGSGKTILIATVSPTDDCVSCSINTLQYANRVRQMTLRNRVKQQNNNNNKSTFLNSDLPPKSRKTYKDIFNNDDEETINNNNNNNNNIKTYIASSPISQDNNVKIPLVSSNTDTVTSKQVPSLFHPSKINMSSTPIKTVTNVTTTTTTTNKQTLFFPNTDKDLLLFENDTPIKGHKLKYIAPPTTNNIQPIQHLADQYFARVVSKPNDLNNKMYYSKLNKNEDAESGVESEELNKSNEQQQLNNNKKQNQINTTNVDESLNRLRKKQKELIESKKYLNAIQFEETQADSTVNGSKLNENSHFYMNNNSNNNNNNNQKHSDQGHLKTYIQNLENKLQNLRNEMNDNNNNNQYQINKKEVIRERSLSTDSCDSLKEIKKNDIRQVYLNFWI